MQALRGLLIASSSVQGKAINHFSLLRKQIHFAERI